MDREAEACPFLVPVIVDRLWLYPVSLYCRRPDHRVRVLAARTLASVCTGPAHAECAGYRASMAQRTKGGEGGEAPG